MDRAREGLEAAKRAAVDAARRRDELEQKIESYRVLQERRQLRLEHVRNPKEASTLMAELDLARSVVAKEENDWVRSSDAVTQAQFKAAEEERNVDALAEGQTPERDRLAARRQELEAELAQAQQEREESASQSGAAAADPLRPAPQGALGRRDRPPGGWGVRRLPHLHPAQSSQSDPGRHRGGQLRGVRRDPVPTRGREVARVTLPGVRLSW